MSRRPLLHLAAALALALAITACPSDSPVPPPDGAGPGDPCDAQTVCQGGLECLADKCVFLLCTSALDRDAACAEKLGLPQAQVECLSDGTCRARRAQLDQPCDADAQCEFGLVCEAVCVETCVSHASCRVAGESCQPREANSAQRVCQPYTTCEHAPDPRRFCVEALELLPEVVACEEGACVARRYEEGSYCTLDAQCADGLVCEGRACTPACQSQCESPLQRCGPRLAAQGNACHPLTGCALEEDPTAHCEAQTGQRARCDLSTGACEPLPITGTFDAILIRDTSDPATSCDPDVLEPFAPGVDIINVTLQSQRNNVSMGYPVAIALSEQSPPHDFTRAQELFSGEPLMLGFNGCPHRNMLPPSAPTLRPEVVVSLGCGGQLWLRFVNEQGGPMTLSHGSYLTLYSFIPYCGPEGVAGDSYEVLGCTSEGDALCDSTDCLRCDTPLLLPGRTGRQIVFVD